MDTAQAPFLAAAATVLIILLSLFAGFALIIMRSRQQVYEIRNNAFLTELGTLEKERTRIARDLHDELTPMLTQAFMCVDVCSNRYGEGVADFLTPSKEILGEVIDRMADIIKNLDDSRVLERGLKQSVLKILEQYRELQRLQFTFNYTVKKELPRAITLGLYRILLELVQNTIKHARASAIEVQIWEWRSFLFFYYKDNGVGARFPRNPEGTGLKSLQHRIELLGGIYESRRDGENFQFRIPLKPVKNGSL